VLVFLGEGLAHQRLNWLIKSGHPSQAGVVVDVLGRSRKWYILLANTRLFA
jgi:hypothetical protein